MIGGGFLMGTGVILTYHMFRTRHNGNDNGKNDNNVYEVKKFKMDIPQGAKILCIGPRFCGKTWIIKDFLYHINPKNVLVFANDKSFPDTVIYNEFLQPWNVYGEYSKDVMYQWYNSLSDKNEGVIVYDNVLPKQFENVEESIIMASQDINQVPSTSSFDIIVMFKTLSVDTRQQLYKKFCNFIPTFTQFSTIMDECTNYHECMIINKNEEKVYWYKAEPHPYFKIGIDETKKIKIF
jgi:GTPase SAR1 family protein